MHPFLQFVFITSIAAVGLSLATTIAFHIAGVFVEPFREGKYLEVLMNTTSRKEFAAIWSK